MHAAKWARQLGPRLHPQQVTWAYYDPGSATRLTSITSSPRLLIRSISPDRAPRSGSSVRRVVVPGPIVTSQSSNSARSVVPARPRNVISYVCDCTGLLLPGLVVLVSCLQHAAPSPLRNRPFGGDTRSASPDSSAGGDVPRGVLWSDMYVCHVAGLALATQGPRREE